MGRITLEQESYKVIGACMEVHAHLGAGFLEIVYKDALEHEFKLRGIPYVREKKYEVVFKGVALPHYFCADFVAYENIILEVKAVSAIADEFIKQTLNYIAIAKSPLGIIVNFGTPSLQFRRVVL